MTKTKCMIIGKGSDIGTKFIEKYGDYYDIQEYDIENLGLAELNLSGIDVVLMLAAIVHQTSKVSKEKYFEVNSELPLEVYKHSKESGVKKFVFMSSIHVYGRENSLNYSEKPLTSLTVCHPISNYGRSKLDAELKLLNEKSTSSLLCIIRSPLVISNKNKGNIPLLTKLAKIPFAPIFCKYNRRSIITIDDLLDYFKLLIEEGQSYEIHTPYTENVSTSDLLIKYLKVDAKVRVSLPKFLVRFLSKISVKITKVYGDLYYE